jgi:small nuclear ribonucleoprotein (snRNP)-like protein
MNIILEGATEYKNEQPTANFGNIIVRGNNVLYVCIDKP